MSAGLLWGMGILLLPALAIVIDGFAGVHARAHVYQTRETAFWDFRILVPIWGNVKYLTNAEALARYSSRVTLCTTGDESTKFYEALQEIADHYGFQIYVDLPREPQQVSKAQARATGGTTRDRLVRNAVGYVEELIVIPLDADSIPSGPFEFLAGEFMQRNLDLASVRIVPSNTHESALTRLQALEYRIAMQIKHLAPWMLSGACHVARTEILYDVMRRHSLFFQGNDVETGLIADALGYNVGHIAFDVLSDVPATLKPWIRQRLAWAGGQFRLFIVNIRFARWHPFMWLYGAGVVYLAFLLRFQSITHSGWRIPVAVAGYLTLVLYLYARRGKGRWWAIGMPMYTLFASFVLTPLGIIWYAKMALASRNPGIIRLYRTPIKAVGSRSREGMA